MAGGKGKKAAVASAAAHAASKRRSAAVDISADTEANVRDLLACLDVASPSSTPEATAADAESIVEVYEQLASLGVKERHIQRALQLLFQAVARQGLSLDAALDWLCMHIEPDELPTRLAGSARLKAGSEGVKILARAQARQLTKASPKHDPDAMAKEQQWRQLQAEAEAKKAREQQATEAERQRAWIKQYMNNEDDSDAASDEGKQDEIEDWELWGDPREVERRKAERKKASMPLEQRRAQLAEEWSRAKSEAARAKAAADKARQKAAGLVIRDLKLEMKDRGISEEELQALQDKTNGPPEEVQQIAVEAEPSLEFAGPSWAVAENDMHEEIKRSRRIEDAEVSHEATSQKSNSSEGSAFELGAGMFEEATEVPDKPFEISAKAQKPKVQPWGPVQAPKKGRKDPRDGKGKAAKKAEPKAPKALLQQLCQKEGCSAPRFSKATLGGNRLPTAGIRYSVTVELPVAKHVKKGKKAARQRTFSLREDDDGWESINDAQNAVAALVLFEVFSHEDIGDILPEVHQMMWRNWEDARTAPASNDGTKTDMQAFAEALASSRGEGPNVPPSSAGRSTEEEQAIREARPTPKDDRSGGGAAQLATDSQALLDSLQHFRASSEGQKWMQHRQQLPVSAIQADLLAALKTQDVMVVGGDTGCGKTTQVPQYLLDASIEEGRGAACSIICTQPRRIAAMSVAQRVSQERGEPPPGARGGLTGYHVRLDDASTKSTRLLFCTTGILLRRLASEPRLASVSHVVVDEVHERTIQGDFLIALLREVLAVRRASGNPLKVVLMSATLDSGLFSDYFGGCGALAAGGRTFPVEQLFLEDVYEMLGYRLDTEGPAALRRVAESRQQKALQKATGAKQGLVKAGWGDDLAGADASNPNFRASLYDNYSQQTRRNLAYLNEVQIDYELLEELVLSLAESPEHGAILVFLPGMGEISSLQDRLTCQRAFREGHLLVLPLHSSVAAHEQRRAFDVPPAGVRKIVLATNIAETSLTISDVRFVVDSGKLKAPGQDERIDVQERRHHAAQGMSLLVEDWISRANALQRRGRAGRVQAGKCFALYTRDRFEHRMRAFQAPEMVRVPLEELILQIHLLKLGRAVEFLGKVLEPPPEKSIQAAVAQLQSLGALSPDEKLTSLGHHLAQLPMDARIGKLLLLAASLECLSPALTIAACLSHKVPFAASTDQQQAVETIKTALAAPGSGNLASGQQSDHLLMVAVFQGWTAAREKGGMREGDAYARKHMLQRQTLDMLADMRAQFATMLADVRIITLPDRAVMRQPNWMDNAKQPFNRQAQEAPLIKAVLCAALYPNVAVMHDSAGKTSRPAWSDVRSDVHIHPGSVNHMLEAHRFLRPYLVYLEKVKTSRVFLRDCTVVSPMCLLLFGGELEVRHGDGVVLVDGWLRVRAAAPVAVLVRQLRKALDGLLAHKIRQPETNLSATGADLVATVVRLLRDEAAAQKLNP